MLSYMVPSSIEDKPPPIPVPAKHHLQLDLSPTSLPNGHHKQHQQHQQPDSLDIPSTHSPVDKSKSKKVTNGATKQTTLKRVSFGSSKGSMVETLIYESPVQEETETNSPNSLLSESDPHGADGAKCLASKVRVSFFESEKASVISTPEAGGADSSEALESEVDCSAAMNSGTFSDHLHHHPPSYNRQASTDSGWDNPFRPDGDLSREADQIVELIKGGKPITPTPGNTGNGLSISSGVEEKNGNVTSPMKANGNAPSEKKIVPAGGVEVQRGTVGTPGDVEHIVIKKKPMCKCCVIL